MPSPPGHETPGERGWGTGQEARRGDPEPPEAAETAQQGPGMLFPAEQQAHPPRHTALSRPIGEREQEGYGLIPAQATHSDQAGEWHSSQLSSRPGCPAGGGARGSHSPL